MDGTSLSQRGNYGDLTLNPQCPCKNLCRLVRTYNVGTGEIDTEDP